MNPPPYDHSFVGHSPLMQGPPSRWNKPSPIITTSLEYAPPPSPSDVPTAVSTLLGLTKQLQETLRLWSIRQASETQVSDAYILVGMQFNATVNAFARYHVDLSDLYGVPTELRAVLETCLGDDPSPRALEQYMAQIRNILYNLLQGLQAKQIPYRKAIDSQRFVDQQWVPTPADDYRKRTSR